MKLTFKDDKIRTLCEQQRLAQKRLGDACARKLHRRLADLEAAEVVTDLLAGRPHPLKHDRDGQFALDLAGGKRLVFRPAAEPVPQTTDGATDWSKVTAVQIIYTGDYHD